MVTPPAPGAAIMAPHTPVAAGPKQNARHSPAATATATAASILPSLDLKKEAAAAAALFRASYTIAAAEAAARNRPEKNLATARAALWQWTPLARTRRHRRPSRPPLLLRVPCSGNLPTLTTNG
ncbi:hypothetical protein PVAP13_9KG390749 [Panicum virgatum]|uniref:Uncharacterized protein n=1 Tax=Panicum virgatum TaxID=38727 RepID=A0A8T0NR28_PANVG|nr:hypothetical protein PVAP13_9KG390749 [Panicum virgatum]